MSQNGGGFFSSGGALKLDCGTGIWQAAWVQLEGIGRSRRGDCGGGGAADHAAGLSLVLSDQRSDWAGDCGSAYALVQAASDQGAGRGAETSARTLESGEPPLKGAVMLMSLVSPKRYPDTKPAGKIICRRNLFSPEAVVTVSPGAVFRGNLFAKTYSAGSYFRALLARGDRYTGNCLYADSGAIHAFG